MGTSSTTAAVADDDGVRVAKASGKHGIRQPRLG
jgi:hypothetical protein